VSVIKVEALELSKGGVNEAVEKAVNNVLKEGERIAAGFEALRPF
jgi:hypothetical protein